MIIGVNDELTGFLGANRIKSNHHTLQRQLLNERWRGFDVESTGYGSRISPRSTR